MTPDYRPGALHFLHEADAELAKDAPDPLRAKAALEVAIMLLTEPEDLGDPFAGVED